MDRRFSIRALVVIVVLGLSLFGCGDDDGDLPTTDAGGDAGRADLGDAGFDGGADLGACPDVDGDGHGAIPCGDDCDDADGTRYPSAAELCDYGGHDEDCNDATYGAKDDDVDGYVDARCCNGTTCGLDCDDTRGGAHPGLPEVCSRRDEDCNGIVDEDSQVDGFADRDRDLYGDRESPTMACAGSGLSVNSTDCDDTSGTAGRASPAFSEVAGDGIDNNCNGTIDEGAGPAALWYRDADGDGFGVGTATSSSVVLAGYALLAGDCDDGDGTLSPVAAELCNGRDDDCNGQADFAIGINDWEDDDGDGFIDAACGGTANDCDDGDRSTYVGAPELCDGRDNDCDSMIDEACAEPMDGGVPIDLGVDLGAPDLGFDAGPPPGTAWYQKASNTDPNDYFGYAIALSEDGTTLAVGAYGEASSGASESDDTAPGAGAVYVFVRMLGVWVPQAYLKASNADAGDAFGWSVALSADGSRLAVGAYHEDSNSIGDPNSDTSADSGAAYMFARSLGVWTQEAYVKASNPDPADWFGSSVALSGDGLRLVVGAPQEDSNARGIGGGQGNNVVTNAGAAYVFDRAGGTWSQQAYVKASNTGPGDNFGNAVSLSRDGLRLAVSGYLEASTAMGVGGDETNAGAMGAGAVYVFLRTGATWAQEAYVKASNTNADDRFGTRISLCADGTRLAVGAHREDSNATGIGGDQTNNTLLSTGAVYVFTRSGATWSQEAYVKASNTGNDDRFGIGVALSADGSRLAVGAYTEDSAATGVGGDETSNASTNSGAVYEYTRVGTTWTQAAYVKAPNTGADDQFGWMVALSGDGAILVVDAPQEDSSAVGSGGDQSSNAAAESGAVYIY